MREIAGSDVLAAKCYTEHPDLLLELELEVRHCLVTAGAAGP